MEDGSSARKAYEKSRQGWPGLSSELKLREVERAATACLENRISRRGFFERCAYLGLSFVAAESFLASTAEAFVGFRAGMMGKRAKKNLLSSFGDLGLTSSLQVCLDAGSAASYNGSSGTWVNLVGSGQDFWLGDSAAATAADPTFNGTAGALTSSEYFSFDGGDFFTLNQALPTWVHNLHKNAALATYVLWVYHAGSLATTAGWLGTSGSTASDGPGFIIYNSPTGPSNRYWISNGSAHQPQITGGTPALNAWTMLTWSIDENGGASGSWFCLNDSSVSTFNASVSSPGGNSVSTFNIGAVGDGEMPALSGCRVAMVAIWTTNLSAANKTAIWNATKGRFGF